MITHLSGLSQHCVYHRAALLFLLLLIPYGHQAKVTFPKADRSWAKSQRTQKRISVNDNGNILENIPGNDSTAQPHGTTVSQVHAPEYKMEVTKVDTYLVDMAVVNTEVVNKDDSHDLDDVDMNPVDEHVGDMDVTEDIEVIKSQVCHKNYLDNMTIINIDNDGDVDVTPKEVSSATDIPTHPKTEVSSATDIDASTQKELSSGTDISTHPKTEVSSGTDIAASTRKELSSPTDIATSTPTQISNKRSSVINHNDQIPQRVSIIVMDENIRRECEEQNLVVVKQSLVLGKKLRGSVENIRDDELSLGNITNDEPSYQPSNVIKNLCKHFFSRTKLTVDECGSLIQDHGCVYLVDILEYQQPVICKISPNNETSNVMCACIIENDIQYKD